MDKLTSLLKQKVPALESIGPAESVAIILNLLNTNPADLPDMPSQIILSLKKQDACLSACDCPSVQMNLLLSTETRHPGTNAARARADL